ncbi:MAG: extracellular solute-binding protein, partial [candidate division FCPU426 bacterium]
MRFAALTAWSLFVLLALPLRADVVLRIPGFPNENKADLKADAEREGIRIFEARYPHIKINRFQGIKSIGNLTEASELMALAGGTAPDVLDVFVHKVQNYIDQGFAQPIEDKLEGWEGRKNMPDVFWPSVTRGKHVYGVVHEWYSLQLMYRKDMFKEAGLDPERPPQTWDELYDYAQRLTFPDKIVSEMTTNKKGQYGFQLNGAWAAAWQFPIWVWQAGGDVVVPYIPGEHGAPERRMTLDELYAERLTIDASKVKWRVTFDSPASVAALEFWKKLVWGKWTRDGKEYTGVVTTTSFGSNTDMDEFGRGKVAMRIYSPSWYALDTYGLAPSQIGIAPLPAGPGGRANYAAGDLYMINSSVKDPELRDAAWKYIEFKTSDEFRRILVKHMIQADAPYQLKPEELIRFGYTSFYEKFPRNWIETSKVTSNNLHVETYAPNYQVVQTNELVIPLSKVLDDKDADPYTELHATTERVNSFIYGIRPAAEQARLRLFAKIGFVLALLGLATIFYFFFRKRKSDDKLITAGGQTMFSAKGATTHIKVWSMLAMALLSMLIWSYLPLIQGAGIAFMDYRIIGESRWIGLDNFIEFFTQPQFLQIVWATIYYVGASLTFGFVAPILLALLLAEIPRFKVLFRVGYYLPAVMAPA